MPAEDAIRTLIQILNEHTSIQEGVVYEKMQQRGVPARDANRAYHMLQTVCGRLVLADVGVKLSPDYNAFSGRGDLVDFGQLLEEPFYLAAVGQVKHLSKQKAMDFAQMSAEFHAVNNALNGGSKPEHLVLSPVCLFESPPTEDGMRKVNEHLQNELKLKRGKLLDNAKAKSRAGGKKPWWRFW